MMIPGFVTIIVIEVSYVCQKKKLFGPKCHGCVFFVVIVHHAREGRRSSDGSLDGTVV